MSLQAYLQSAYADFQKAASAPVIDTFNSGVQALQDSFDASKAIRTGQKFPEFTLKDPTGNGVTGASLLAKGPLLLSFYRGEWCPFCNLELRALQFRLPESTTAGVTLAAVSPQFPDTSLFVVEKHALEFPVLSDVGNRLARQLGIVWKQPEALGPILAGFGVDWERKYGDQSLEVPIPATVLVGADGVVRNVFLDPDYTKRLEPETALEWVRALYGCYIIDY